MTRNPKIIVFDFCDTLVSFQTANKFVEFVGSKESPIKFYVFNFIFRLFWKFRLWPLIQRFTGKVRMDKKFYLKILKGISEDKINRYGELYYTQKIRPNFIPEVYSVMLSHIDNGDIVVISSGGYDAYLKIFCKEHNIEYLSCSTIKFKNDRCTGALKGEDCMGEQKVVELKKMFPKISKVDEAYSDSNSDTPLLRYSKEAYVISRSNHQSWIENFACDNFKEIIWK